MGRRKGIDGKELLLSAALRLFSEKGIDAVSIRHVTREAGLGPAAVHYHFGTKEALIEAVLHAYGASVISETKERAREILAANGPATARDLVTMLADPYLDLVGAEPSEGVAWLRVVAKLSQSDSELLLDRSSSKLTWKAASRVYPDAPPDRVQRAMRMCFTLLVSQLALAHESTTKGPNVELDLLIDFLSAGLDGALRSPSNAAHARRRTA
jgi:AcrR family transcriptional regulator